MCKRIFLAQTVAVSIFCSIFIFACTAEKQNPGAPLNLRCEYQQNPLGIDILTPRLSWQVNDSRRGAVQTAYQILVASNGDLLKADQADIWDSGQIHSEQSVQVSYNGPALESQKRYFWKVRTWDATGVASPYSKTAWWEMGLLKPADWQAKWIGKTLVLKAPEKEPWPWGYWIWHPTEIGIDKPVYFRKKFTIPAKKIIKSALIRTTADNYFTAFVNGEEIGSGIRWSEVYEFEVAAHLKSGENIVAISAANNRGDVCGLIFSLKIEFTDETSLVINSDQSWKTAERKKSGWMKFKFIDKKWLPVRVIEEYGGPQWGKIDPTDVYNPPRSVYVRNEFTAKKDIRRARAYVTGLGSYIMYINGQRVGNDIFTPGWTEYPTRIQYQTYDVTSRLQVGENAVGAVLGNMWWSGGLGWMGSYYYSEGPLRFLLQLVIDYQDGSREIIVTDPSWKTHDSPILDNHIYHGETYDARLELPGWNQPGFDGSNWEPVMVLEKDQARLVAQQSPPIQITQELAPQSITEPDSGVYVFDLGQNMVGWVRLQVAGPAGTPVTLRFAEVLKTDGNIYVENLRGARATDIYILKGQGTEIWEPHFTYHGFRYVEITGYPGEPGKDALIGRVFHSTTPSSGTFACSNELLNQIQQNINWGLRGNLMSVPTDCPQRDERLGWMGDAQIFAPTACYNRNMARFFSKWMRDIIDCQEADGAVYDVNPAIVVGGPAKPGWGDAVVIIPWVVYQFYGDKRIIEENYDGMAAWVNFMQQRSPNHLYEQDGYGDWVAVEKSPAKPIGAAYFYYSTQLLSKMAAIIGKTEDAEHYDALASDIVAAFNAKYLDQTTNEYEGATQTANLLPLAFGITPSDLKIVVGANIVKNVQAHDNHLTTGFLGTPYLLPILSQLGQHELAYQLAVEKTYPSWGYMVEKGATTIWELWNSDTEGPGMNSRNHFALGSVGEWYYGYLAGIRPDPDFPGFKQTIIAPQPVADLTWAEAALETVYGLVKCRWENALEKFLLDVDIPANTRALVHLPKFIDSLPTVLENGQFIMRAGEFLKTVGGIEFVGVENDVVILKVSAGSYHFEIRSGIY